MTIGRSFHFEYQWVALSLTTIGALMAAIDLSAVIVALPSILVNLDADFITIMWVLLGYMLIMAAIVPVVGRLADMFGRKNLFNLGFIIFVVAHFFVAYPYHSSTA